MNAAVCTYWLPEVARTWRVSDLSPHHCRALPGHSDAAGGSSSHPRCPGRGLVPQGLARQEVDVEAARR